MLSTKMPTRLQASLAGSYLSGQIAAGGGLHVTVSLGFRGGGGLARSARLVCICIAHSLQRQTLSLAGQLLRSYQQQQLVVSTRLTHDDADQQDVVLHPAEVGAAHLMALEAGGVLRGLKGLDQTNTEDDLQVESTHMECELVTP